MTARAPRTTTALMLMTAMQLNPTLPSTTPSPVTTAATLAMSIGSEKTTATAAAVAVSIAPAAVAAVAVVAMASQESDMLLAKIFLTGSAPSFS